MGQYNIKQVIVVRKDLKMRKGKIAAQCAHASMKILLDRMSNEDSFEDNYIHRILSCENNSYLNQWLEGSFAKIVVSCDSLEELIGLKIKADVLGIPTAQITDSGATEFNGEPTITCLAIGPYDAKELDKITGHLKLL